MRLISIGGDPPEAVLELTQEEAREAGSLLYQSVQLAAETIDARIRDAEIVERGRMVSWLRSEGPASFREHGFNGLASAINRLEHLNGKGAR